MPAPLLELRGVSKSFPGVRALDAVSLDLAGGEVLALMGENGAGKSTLVKLLCGVYQPDAGEIRLDGEPVTIRDPSHAQALGISPVHQELHLEPELSVAENIFLGRQPTNRFGFIRWQRMLGEAATLLDGLSAGFDGSRKVGTLSIAQRQVVAIARAVSTSARVIIFDEPTSSLTERESEALFGVVRRLRDAGIGIVYISHRMNEVFRLSDRVSVLRDGRSVGMQPTPDLTLGALITMMVGRDVGDLFRKTAAPVGAPVLEAAGLVSRGVLHDISFTLRAGEIVGMAGLVGAGRTELARAIFGDLPMEAGRIEVDGQALRSGHSPRDAIAAGIGLVPEDRKDQGLVTELSVRQNISLAALPGLASLTFVNAARERRLARASVDRLGIKTPSIEQRAKFLSGGNQQRVVIAKWLAMRPKVLIVDEPTRGIDVKATAEIHALLCDLAREGVAILMISSDLPEVLAISDRILVMHEGRIAGELSAEEADQESVMHLATGQGGASRSARNDAQTGLAAV